MKKILVPIDGSQSAQEALMFAITMAEAYGDEIRIISVQRHEILAETMIQEASALLEDHKRPYSTGIRVGTVPSIEIVTEAKDDSVRCIVMGSKGAGKTTNKLGSVSTAVLAMAPCPVVIVPD